MSATVESLQMLTAGPKRWVLVRSSALPVALEFSWSERLEDGTRFEDADAELLVRNRGDLPLLPTEPPTVPIFLRAVHGIEAPLEFPASSVVRPEPEFETGGRPPLREMVRPGGPRTREGLPRKVTPQEAFEMQERRHLA